MKTLTVNYQKSYVVTPSTDGTIKTSEGVTICSFTAGAQCAFVAPCEEVQCSDDDAIITRSFSGAPLGVSSTGGSAYELPTATTTTLGGVKLLSSYSNTSTSTYAATPYAVYAVYQFTQTNAAAIGTLSDLSTSSKTNLVTAINEVASGSGSSGGILDYTFVPVISDTTITISLNTERATELNLTQVYGITFDSISIEDATSDKVSTAELWLRLGVDATQFTWPSSLIWLDDGSAPAQLESYTKYCFIVRQDADGQQIINLAYSYSIDN